MSKGFAQKPILRLVKILELPRRDSTRKFFLRMTFARNVA